MAGHNKWSKIKNRKAVTDAYKAKTFGKLIKAISVESKLAKGDISSPSLKNAVEKARLANVPSDNIERAIKKGAGTDFGATEKIIYEAYGPGGCALIIEAMTDNRNRASQEIKHILSKNGFGLATPGSAMWAFEKNQEQNWVAKTNTQISEDDGIKLNNLIEELEENDEVQEVFTNAE